MSAPGSALEFAHPAVRRWFERTHGRATPAQVAAWPLLAARQSVLLLAPTGSGKTLAAFLVAIDALLRAPGSERKTRVLYVSPLKALGVDVEKNLEEPLRGIRAEAEALGTELGPLEVGVRSGDTPQKRRVALVKRPPEILITTPESLYLMLTSRARETLRDVETVIIDEIHAIAGSKRGAHLFANLERLESLVHAPFQRVGLSATQRPLSEIARLLGGYHEADGAFVPREVAILDVESPRRVELRVETPGTPGEDGGSTWASIHPRLLELVRAHRSTMIFVNNRSLAERLAGALNELAREELVLAHHGSIAKERRELIEDRLKRGELRAVVTTSSLELGIDVGAVDLVVQIEAPISIASGIQRVGRAGHQVGGTSRGVLMPKWKGDLVAAAAAAKQMLARRVEETRPPKNPLDVLAQVIVAEVAGGPVRADALFALVRRAAPFAELSRAAFDGVLDMLSGRYPSERFRELRARLVWDRRAGLLVPRRGTRMLAVQSGGTIPDRGLFGVYLSGAEPALKLGELDEEMVFESRVGEVFLLGASSWRIDQISHDRVLVTPAPGEPGKMPFWRGAGFGRSLELGLEIGRLQAAVEGASQAEAVALLEEQHRLTQAAALALVEYVSEQKAACALPTDRRVVVEWFPDEGGDLRVVVLAPFGGRVHAPWLLLVLARLRREFGAEVDATVLDDGMVFRLPRGEREPLLEWFLPDPDSARRTVEAELGHTALFAARFRESAARALLLPRRAIGRRTPLWVQARRARDLLSVARDYPEFPIVLETYRECLSEAFDLGGLEEVLSGLATGEIEARFVSTSRASPFAASLLFSFAGNFIYDNDTPLAERRAQSLHIDHARLRELLGEPELRQLLDPRVLQEVEARLQRLDGHRPIDGEEDVYDLLWELGDLTRAEIQARVTAAGSPELAAFEGLQALVAAGRVVPLHFGAEERLVVVEDAASYRDALGVVLPEGVPVGLAEFRPDALSDLLLRYARRHGPFLGDALVQRYGAEPAALNEALERLVAAGVLVRGAFLPEGTREEYCHPDVLARLRQGSRARARREVEPVSTERYADFLLDWHEVESVREGPDAILAAIEQLEGLELPLADLEAEILPRRVRAYDRRDLDELCASGEVLWTASSGERDPRVRLYLREHHATSSNAPERAEGSLCQRLRELLGVRGASFYSELVSAVGGFEPDVFAALWKLVWAGEVTGDTLQPLRSLLAGDPQRARPSPGQRARRVVRPGSEGRFSLVPERTGSSTEQARALAQCLLARHGIVTRETLRREAVPGGFTALYPVLRALEEAGHVRRGYFVAGLGGAQFAYRGAEGRLRAAREPRAATVLAACDPANAYGASLPWPRDVEARFARAPGTYVVVHEGRLCAYVGRGLRAFTLRFDDADTEAAFVAALDAWFERSSERAWRIETIDGEPAHTSPRRALFERASFVRTGDGLLRRRG